MKQQYLKENLWQGGVHLDGDMFREIVQPSFCCVKVPEPERLWLPMKNEDGPPCRVSASVGDYVEKYAIVGIRDTGILEDFHVVRTALPGRVTAIGQEQTGYRAFAEYVEIEACEQERSDNTGWQMPFVCGKGEKDLVRMRAELMHSGIPGVNRILFEGSQVRCCDLLVLNAVVDDPSIFYDSLMIKERPGQLLYGLLIFFRLLGAERIVIAVSGREKEAVRRLLAASRRYFTEDVRRKMSVIGVPDIYPGGRDELLAVNLQMELKNRKCVMVYPDQVFGAYDMIYDQKPWVSRRLMVGGCTSANGCYDVPIGMGLGELGKLYRECQPLSAYVLIDGGLMAGKAIDPEKAVVHGEMRSVIILPRVEENEQSCIACHRCAEVCPVAIRPYMEVTEADRMRCVGCGNCSYICPSRRRLKEFILRGCNRKHAESCQDGYIYLPGNECKLLPAVMTGYSSPYIRLAKSPFTCILSPFKL